MPIKVLVVDDSFAMRVVISDLLNSDSLISVIDTVESGIEALKKLEKIKPDCIILDLMMPEMNGFETLKAIMAKFPLPVIVFSAYSETDAKTAFKCLAAGAVSFVPKPSGDASWDIEYAKNQLLAEVKGVSNLRKFTVELSNKIKKINKKFSKERSDKIIVMGSSTGGPQTLEAMLSLFPQNFPVPIVIAQPMFGFFLDEFVKRLNKRCVLPVKLIENEEAIQGGIIYCVPDSYRVVVKKQNDIRHFYLEPNESEGRSHCIDDCMNSVADAYGANTIGIILTGIGKDGLSGAKAIKALGGHVIVQDDALYLEKPKVVAAEGIADLLQPMENIPEAIVEMLSS